MNVRIITTRHAEAEWSSVVVGTADPDAVRITRYEVRP